MKYLNGVLTIIAGCLLLITMSLLGAFPTANAKGTNQHIVSVPVNPDGSINVKLMNETLDVNLQEVSGHDIDLHAVPVTIEK